MSTLAVLAAATDVPASAPLVTKLQLALYDPAAAARNAATTAVGAPGVESARFGGLVHQPPPVVTTLEPGVGQDGAALGLSEGGGGGGSWRLRRRPGRARGRRCHYTDKEITSLLQGDD